MVFISKYMILSAFMMAPALAAPFSKFMGYAREARSQTDAGSDLSTLTAREIGALIDLAAAIEARGRDKCSICLGSHKTSSCPYAGRKK